MVFECNLYTQYVYTSLVWQDQPWQKPRGKHSWPTATRACRLVFASVDPATLEKYKLLDSCLTLTLLLRYPVLNIMGVLCRHHIHHVCVLDELEGLLTKQMRQSGCEPEVCKDGEAETWREEAAWTKNVAWTKEPAMSRVAVVLITFATTAAGPSLVDFFIMISAGKFRRTSPALGPSSASLVKVPIIGKW